MEATAIVQRNSLAFVEEVFAAARARRTLVSVPDASQARRLRGISVDRCIDPPMRTGWYSGGHELIDDDLPAQILHTSGTEGEPKAIVLTYGNQAAASRRLIHAMGMTAEIREYVGVPVTYSFGMGRFRAIAAVGGHAYLSPRGFDPLELAQMLQAGDVNALSAVPTLLRILLDAPEVIGTAGAKLRWLEIGSQYMSAGEKRRVREMFPNARIIQHYGLTEASRSTFLDIRNASDAALDSVGAPDDGVEIGFDEGGRICIRGPHIARTRVDAQGLHSLCDADGWLHTNDLGRLQDGCLFFEGRADDVINCGGLKVVPDLLETRIGEKLGAATRYAVARVADSVRGEAVLVVTENARAVPALRSAATAALAEMGVAAAGNLHVRHIDAIPVTTTGKPRRREISAWFEQNRDASPPPATRSVKHRGDVRSLFEHIFPGAEIGPQDTFSSLGGDSLRYIQFSMEFERRFGLSPARWETMTVAQLQQRADSSRRTILRHLEPAALMRAVAMMLIVARHASTFSYSRKFGAGVLLFALGGYALARFQLPEILRRGSVRNALGTALLVAIPTVLTVAAMQLLTHQHVDVPAYLMLANLFDPLDPVRSHSVSFYFAQIYFQLLLLGALLFAIPGVRRSFREHPMSSALMLLGGAIALKFILAAVWNTDYLYNRVPQYYGWIFCLGIVVGVSSTLLQRLLATVIIVICSYLMWGFDTSSYLVAGGLALVLFVPWLPVPAAVKLLVEEVAAASMFIYLIHFQVRDMVTHFLGAPHPWIAFWVAAAAGIAAFHSYMYVQRVLSQTSVGQRFFRALAGGREIRSGA